MARYVCLGWNYEAEQMLWKTLAVLEQHAPADNKPLTLLRKRVEAFMCHGTYHNSYATKRRKVK